MVSMGKATTLALMSTTALWSITPAVAQDQDDDSLIEELIVTATRRATTVQDVPYNISAVSGQAIDANNMLDASELLRAMPGVAVADIGVRNAGVVSTIKIRGLNVDTAGKSDYAVMAAPTVSSYINDTPLYANVLLKDLDRVEILRGPQGTLYGAGALGGAVRYITNKPELGEFSGKVRGSLSKSNGSGGVNLNGDLVVNMPIGETIAVRLVGSYVDNAGISDYRNLYVLDAAGVPVAPDGILADTAEYERINDADYVETSFFRGSILFKPSEKIDVSLSYTRQSDEIGGRRASGLGADGWGVPYGKYELGSVQREVAEADVELGALEANVDLGFATLTSSSSLYETSGSSISENTGFYANVGWLGTWYYNYPRPLATPARGYGDEAFVQEARLVSNGDGPLNWIAGVYYQDQDKKATQQSFLVGLKAYADALYGFDVPWIAGDQDWDYDAVLNSKETAFFGEVTYDFSEQLHINAGIRHFSANVTSVVHMELPFWVPADIVDVEENVKENGTLFKINASYDFSENDKAYATFSQGYRRGGANAVPLVGWYGETADWLSYKSDTVDNFEVGVKGSHNGTNYTASVFYVDWKDPQINTTSTNGGFFAVANGESATSKGLELELSGPISESLRYSIGYAYVDSKITADFIAPDGRFIAADGSQLPGVPKHMVNVALDYERAINSNLMFFGHLDGYIQSKSQNSINADSGFYGATLEGFSLWNLSGTFSWNELSATLFVKNLLNEEGITGISKQEWGSPFAGSSYMGSGAQANIALPRTFGIVVSYNF